MASDKKSPMLCTLPKAVPMHRPGRNSSGPVANISLNPSSHAASNNLVALSLVRRPFFPKIGSGRNSDIETGLRLRKGMEPKVGYRADFRGSTKAFDDLLGCRTKAAYGTRTGNYDFHDVAPNLPKISAEVFPPRHRHWKQRGLPKRIGLHWYIIQIAIRVRFGIINCGQKRIMLNH